MRLRRELYGLSHGRIAAAMLLLATGGCVSTVVHTAATVVTAPVRVVGAGIDAVAPGQRERDRRRGKQARKAEAAQRQAAKRARSQHRSIDDPR